jgi:hypothetical protein
MILLVKVLNFLLLWYLGWDDLIWNALWEDIILWEVNRRLKRSSLLVGLNTLIHILFKPLASSVWQTKQIKLKLLV